jgi:hypothetical protein
MPTMTAPDTPADPPAPQTFDLTVDEFCMRLSATDGRVEMIAGFHADELRQGRVKGPETAFAARFSAFCVRPA